MNRMSTLLITVMFSVVLLLSGCVNRQDDRTGNLPVESYEVKDCTGYVIKLIQKPHRIVSLSIGTDEILMELVPVDRIAALTYLADDSGISNIREKAKQVPTKIRANAETVISLQPDLVLVPDWQPKELVQIMRDAGLSVYVYHSPTTIDEIKAVIADIALAVGEKETGAKIIASMEAELTKVTERVQQIPAGERLVVVHFSLMGGSGGKDSTFDDICRYAGVENGAAAAGLGMTGILSKEQIVAINPDLLIIPTWDYSGKTDLQKFADEVKTDPALQTVKAVRQQKLIPVPDRYLYCSSQYIVYGVRALAKAAYPQYIGEL